MTLISNVWYQSTSRESNSPFPVMVLEVKRKMALVKHANYPIAAPFWARISSLYNPLNA